MEIIDRLFNSHMGQDRKFTNKVFRKLYKLLMKKKMVTNEEAEILLAKRLGKSEDEITIDPNRPMPVTEKSEIDEFNKFVVELCEKHLNPETIVDQINLVIKREAAKRIIDVGERPDITFSELNAEIQAFSKIMRGETLMDPEEAIGTRVSLIRNLITDQLPFIKIAKKYLTIRDFGEIANNMIGTSKGMGKIGGKAAGLLVAKGILNTMKKTFPEIGEFKIPRSYFLRSDVLSEFIHENNLEEFINLKYCDIDTIKSEYPMVRKTIINSPFLPEVKKKLRKVIEKFGKNPIIVRSSSHLEDSVESAFSGKYLSLFLGNQGSIDENLDSLVNAIIQVYASIFAPDPMMYRQERELIDYPEQMGIIIQEVTGKKYGKYFFPDFAGVAFSINRFRWSPRIKREDGLLRIVMGLGTRAVDRLDNDFVKLVPLGVPTLKTAIRTDEILKYSQKFIDVINLEKDEFETISISELLEGNWEKIGKLSNYISILENGTISSPIGMIFDLDVKNTIVTFDNMLKNKKFTKQMQTILKVLQEAYGKPVDVEFAHNGDTLYILQCRVQAQGSNEIETRIPENYEKDKLLFTANRFVTSGIVKDVEYVVYVDPVEYDNLKSYEELIEVGKLIGVLNWKLPRRKFILLGPGRWGSRGDIKLGVRITYADINNTSMLIEIAKKKGNYVPDLSFGTHFFQDLVESDISYLPLYVDDEDVVFNYDFINKKNNSLEKLIPEYKHLAHCVYIIDVKKLNSGKSATIYMDGDNDKAAAILD